MNDASLMDMYVDLRLEPRTFNAEVSKLQSRQVTVPMALGSLGGGAGGIDSASGAMTRLNGAVDESNWKVRRAANSFEQLFGTMRGGKMDMAGMAQAVSGLGFAFGAMKVMMAGAIVQMGAVAIQAVTESKLFMSLLGDIGDIGSGAKGFGVMRGERVAGEKKRLKEITDATRTHEQEQQVLTASRYIQEQRNAEALSRLKRSHWKDEQREQVTEGFEKTAALLKRGREDAAETLRAEREKQDEGTARWGGMTSAGDLWGKVGASMFAAEDARKGKARLDEDRALSKRTEKEDAALDAMRRATSKRDKSEDYSEQIKDAELNGNRMLESIDANIKLLSFWAP